jgi:hypothetical protein
MYILISYTQEGEHDTNFEISVRLETHNIIQNPKTRPLGLACGAEKAAAVGTTMASRNLLLIILNTGPLVF